MENEFSLVKLLESENSSSSCSNDDPENTNIGNMVLTIARNEKNAIYSEFTVLFNFKTDDIPITFSKFDYIYIY